MIVIQILTRNNEKTIAKTLESLRPLDANIIIGDLGSSDSTLELCRGYGADIRKLDWGNDYSEARNLLLVEDGLNFMIEPWECLVRGHDEIISSDGNFNVTVVRGGSASREIRIWSDLKFKNPVYEFIDDENAGFLEGVAIVAAGGPDRRKEAKDICLRWRDNRPTSPDPWYYSAFSSLALGQIKDFISFAEKYLVLSNKFGPAEVQISYKMAQVLASEGKFSQAAGLTARCLAMHPTFAEFWCLFGDMFLKQKKYEKARSMYVNAINIGSRRAALDSQPIEIDKYSKYPQSRIRLMDEIDKNTGMIITQDR
jgi:tetratricopeptide (TPR) repeat protein